MDIEKRQYPRINTNVSVRYKPEKHSKESVKYLSGIAENCSHGGMLISTDHVIPKGKIITLEFRVKTEDSVKVIEARAIVRWANRWGSQKAMGVEFIEFSGVSNEDFETWMKILLKSETSS